MISKHFVQRVRERIGPHVCPMTLGEGLLWAFRNERHDLLEFIGRVNRRGLRIFRFRVAGDGRHFYVLIDTEATTLVTVMPPGFRTPRQGGGKIELREIEQ